MGVGGTNIPQFMDQLKGEPRGSSNVYLDINYNVYASFFPTEPTLSHQNPVALATSVRAAGWKSGDAVVNHYYTHPLLYTVRSITRSDYCDRTCFAVSHKIL